LAGFVKAIVRLGKTRLLELSYAMLYSKLFYARLGYAARLRETRPGYTRLR
jgi:hypothetical protein